MLITSVDCPHCSKQLKTSKPLKVGQRVLCSRCGQSFTVGSAGRASVVSAPRPSLSVAPLPQPPHLTPQSAALIEERPERVVAPPPLPKRHTLLIALVLGGLFLLLALSVGLVAYFALRQPSSAAPKEIASSASAPTGDRDQKPASVDNRSPPSGDRRTAGDSRLVTEVSSEPEPEVWLPSAEQEKVNKALERGLQWLKQHQDGGGVHGPAASYPVGLASLTALTLLECGVPASDPQVQKALHTVRAGIPSLDSTYELSLVILFLDRLGDPADEKAIQTCAMRLVAGQTATGGWTYKCRFLTPKQENDLLLALRQSLPRDPLDLFIRGPDSSAPPGFVASQLNQPLDKQIEQGPGNETKLLPAGNASELDKSLLNPAAFKKTLERLPPALRGVPALQPPRDAHRFHAPDDRRADASDNSNTQFAILGLTAAERHKLPLDRCLALIVHRFRNSQFRDGRWNYHFDTMPAGQTSAAMTGAGLLGLAVGLGLAADHTKPGVKPQPVKDPLIEKGFHNLAKAIEQPMGEKRRGPRHAPINYYLLWTIERCGVLYKRREIDGKDWYRWGQALLVDAQNPAGDWTGANFHGGNPLVNTCFALLFLKRANLAKDLTKKLEFLMENKQLHSAP